MLRHLYATLMVLAQPFLRRKLARRARSEAGYAAAIEERFGHYAFEGAVRSARSDIIWVHAVSLGETRAAAPLIARLRQQLPGMRLLLTHGTATGRAEGANLLQPGDRQVWQPWDTPQATRRFVAQFRPAIGILIETEVWPNLVAACVQAGVPLVLANARLSDKSLRQARRLAWLARPAYRALTAVWAQTEADAERLRQLGAPVTGVFGNIKFDAAPRPDQLALGQQWSAEQRAGGARPVVMFASSREGEELLLLQTLQEKKPQALVNIEHSAIESGANGLPDPQVQWLIVPRHPQRFDEVAALLASQGFTVSRRSTWLAGPPAGGVADVSHAAPTIWLGDSLGEMALYYGLADAVLLGGSFAPLGGQNLIEAAACGCPVIMGPHTFNFLEASSLAQAAGAARRVTGMAEAVPAAVALVNHRADHAAMVQAALAFAQAHRGAVARTTAAVQALLIT